MTKLVSPSEALSRLAETPPPMPLLTRESDDAEDFFALEMSGIGMLIAAQLSCELVDSTNLCGLPGAPPWLLGVLSVRGYVVPIFDFRLYLSPNDKKKPLLRYAVVNLNGPKSWGVALEKMPEKRRFSEHAKNETELPEIIRDVVIRSYVDDQLWCEFDWHQLFSRLAA